MNDVLIRGTDRLPTISLDARNGIIEIAGRSIPEDGKEFYDEVLKWIKEYSLDAQDVTQVFFKLEYLNSSSQVSIKNIIDQLEEITKEKEVEIEWYYETDDPSMYDTASDFKALTNIPFKITEIETFD